MENNTSKCEGKYSIYVDFYLKNEKIKKMLIEQTATFKKVVDSE